MSRLPGQDSGRRAIALEYDGASAPRISALGSDALAERIIEIAREHGVPMLENHELASLLAQMDLGDEIPETLYLCVAQIIAFAYRLRGRVPEGWEPPAQPEEPAQNVRPLLVDDTQNEPLS